MECLTPPQPSPKEREKSDAVRNLFFPTLPTKVEGVVDHERTKSNPKVLPFDLKESVWRGRI